MLKPCLTPSSEFRVDGARWGKAGERMKIPASTRTYPPTESRLILCKSSLLYFITLQKCHEMALVFTLPTQKRSLKSQFLNACPSPGPRKLPTVLSFAPFELCQLWEHFPEGVASAPHGQLLRSLFQRKPSLRPEECALGCFSLFLLFHCLPPWSCLLPWPRLLFLLPPQGTRGGCVREQKPGPACTWRKALGTESDSTDCTEILSQASGADCSGTSNKPGSFCSTHTFLL